MGNLTAGQLAAFTSGQPVRQVWSIRAPVLADHSAYTTTVLDDGVFAASATPRTRVIKAGSRRHKVWNPHPMSDSRPEAVRYVIEVANGDGYLHRKSGSPWNPFGLYDAAPAECFLIHQIYVLEASSWSEVTHMRFEGRILRVEYSGTAAMTKRDLGGVAVPQEAPTTATITSEQDGAWIVLRDSFDKSHATETLNLFTFSVGGTALTTTSISPTTKTAGSATFTLTVNGTGFSNINAPKVLFDGRPLATTYVSATQLTCTVPASAITVAGSYSITAFRDGPAGSTSNAQTLTVT